MVYYTGDIHGEKYEIVRFCYRAKLTKDDVIVILGDVGANFFCNEQDRELKHALNKLKPTRFCIHGNHEQRPANIPGYLTKVWNGGTVWYEDEYPTLLFAKDGEVFDLDGLSHIVIGGAYSVDKYIRIKYNLGWLPDEQPSDEIKAYVEKQIEENRIDVILSHTCPFRYEPIEAFLPSIDQKMVDTGTERWLDTIEETCEYKQWLCGHWHINKRVDKLNFLYHNFISSEEIKQRIGNSV